jgi:hypothetical protein
MKQLFLFIAITVILILLSSCSTYRDIERYNEPSYYYYRDPMYFNNTFYYWKGYQIYFNKPEYHWTPITQTPKKK